MKWEKKKVCVSTYIVGEKSLIYTSKVVKSVQGFISLKFWIIYLFARNKVRIYGLKYIHIYVCMSETFPADAGY